MKNEAFTEVKGKELLERLKELSKLNQKFNDARKQRFDELNDAIKGIQVNLVSIEQTIIDSKVNDDKKAEKKAQETENELLTRLTLLNQKKENISCELNEAIKTKLCELIPLIFEAKKESIKFSQDKAEKINEITNKMKEIQRERVLLHGRTHIIKDCDWFLEHLLKTANIDKNFLNEKLEELKPFKKQTNPYFN